MDSRATVVQIGLDVHKTFSTVTARGPEGKVVWRQRLNHRERAGLRKQLRSWGKGIPVVLEGTFGWGWLCDELAAAELEPHLASSRKLAAWRTARGIAKSNRTDADLLSELWSQQPRWWEVWLVPQEVRDEREWLRYRMSLVAAQTRLKNQIHAVLHRHGILHDGSDLFGVQGRRFLQQLVTPEAGRLRDSTRTTLKGYLRLLEAVRRQLAAATYDVRRRVRRNPMAERLRSLPGISWILAYTIFAEIGRIERFANAKHLASYSLLVPVANDTGEEDDEPPTGRHVGFLGRKTLKWAFIEAAHGAVRHGGCFGELFDRRTNGGKRDRNRGHIAVGHALCRLTYVLWTKETEYTETPQARPGRRT